MLQISNISQVSVAVEPEQKVGIGSILAIVVGILMIYLDYILNVDIGGIGWILIVLGMFYIICIFIGNKNRKRYIYIFLNSGNVYCIVCENESFLSNAKDVIEYCINNHSNQIIKIDFDNCRMDNCPIVFGNNNDVEVK